MVDEKVLFQLLEKTQAEFARAALEHPSGRDAFDYGRSVGVMAGIALVKTEIDALLSDKNDRENRL